jgi:hypothetical protein
MRTSLTAPALILLVAAAFSAEPKPGAEPVAPKKPRYGPNDVEVRLLDGSLIRGGLLGLEQITLQTRYGALAFPAPKLLHVTRARRMPADEAQEVAQAIKDLDNDDFARRNAAQQKLEAFGAAAAPLLADARQNASAEARTRIDALLKKTGAPGTPKLQTDDVVRVEEFEARGVLKLESFKLKTRVGDLVIKVDDIAHVRWLAKGGFRTLDLDAASALQDWVDTGLDAVPGGKLAVTCSGTMTLWGNNGFTPNGNPNWGGSRQKQFPAGAVIGKLGANGAPFLIGASKEWTAETADRLFVRLHYPDEMRNRGDDNHSGQFSLRAASGAWADEINE